MRIKIVLLGLSIGIISFLAGSFYGALQGEKWHELEFLNSVPIFFTEKEFTESLSAQKEIARKEKNAKRSSQILSIVHLSEEGFRIGYMEGLRYKNNKQEIK